MRFSHHILLLLFLLSASFVYAQTPGFNYQALILNSEEIQIPGTDVKENQVPLGLEDVTFRFTISNEDRTEYIEEQTVTTDENGMVSLIVGEGTSTRSAFNNIVWDGKLKYLDVEIDILSNNKGFVLLDTQKILYLPHPTNGTSNVFIVDTIDDLAVPYEKGDLVWVERDGINDNTTLMIYNGTNWVPISDDYDTTNELGLIVVEDNLERDTLFNPAIIGDQVWNQACGCLEIYDGNTWIPINTINAAGITTDASNGLYEDNDIIKLGGDLEEPTSINTDATNTLAIKDLEESTSVNDAFVVVEASTGILRKKPLSSLVQQEQIIITATDGQLRFTTPLPISSIDKLDVYRNGARISFTMIDTMTIELEPEAICYEGDEIRIVQIN